MAYAEAIFINSGIYIIATMGLAIFTGYTGLFSLGHAAFMAVGAYTAAICTYFLKVPLFFGLIAGVITAVITSVIIGYPTLRARLRSDYFAIATLGFGEAVKVILENFQLTQGARGLPGIPKLASASNTAFLMILSVWLVRNFLRSNYGRKIIAIGQDHVAAEMIGIRLLPNQILSLAISAGFSGLSGGLLAHYTTFIQPSIFNMDLSSLITAAVVCGGMGSITGPFVAVSLFVIIPELFRGLALWRLVLYGMLLVVIINWRPKGLFGYEELSIANLPKLFIIAGLAIGLALASSVFKAIVESGYQPILGIAAAAGTAVLVTLASGLIGKLFSRFAGPYLVSFRSFYTRGIDRAIDRIGALFGRAPLMVPAMDTQKRSSTEISTYPLPENPPSENPTAEPLLTVSGISKHFGGVVAVDGVDLVVHKGEILGLIGPNGSGKTTVFNLISGVYPIDAGTVRFDGISISNADPTRIVRAGISRTFQNIRLFSKMSVLDNVQTALHGSGTYSLAEAFVQWPWTVRPEERRLKNEAAAILETVGLASESGRIAGTLPYGLQRKLEIARALALKPKLLLLDEPAAGMNPRESEDLVELIRRIHAKNGLAIILIEHHMDVVMNLCRRIAVLNFGKKIAEGDPEHIQSDPAVLKAYLGDKTNAALS
jgi:branched-chain amino acid transport system permease protein